MRLRLRETFGRCFCTTVERVFFIRVLFTGKNAEVNGPPQGTQPHSNKQQQQTFRLIHHNTCPMKFFQVTEVHQIAHTLFEYRMNMLDLATGVEGTFWLVRYVFSMCRDHHDRFCACGVCMLPTYFANQTRRNSTGPPRIG